jgi:hypothetical protein
MVFLNRLYIAIAITFYFKPAIAIGLTNQVFNFSHIISIFTRRWWLSNWIHPLSVFVSSFLGSSTPLCSLLTFSTPPEPSSMGICGGSPLLQLNVLKTFSDMVFDYNKMIDDPFIRDLVIREFMDRFSLPTVRQTIISLATMVKDIQRFYKKRLNNRRQASSL